MFGWILSVLCLHLLKRLSCSQCDIAVRSGRIPVHLHQLPGTAPGYMGRSALSLIPHCLSEYLHSQPTPALTLVHSVAWERPHLIQGFAPEVEVLSTSCTGPEPSRHWGDVQCPCRFWGPERLEALYPFPFGLFLYIIHGKPLEAVLEHVCLHLSSVPRPVGPSVMPIQGYGATPLNLGQTSPLQTICYRHDVHNKP